MDINELRKQIIAEFSPMWENNDKAHRETHFEEVFQLGMIINDDLKLGYDDKLILFAAYFHDMFAWSRNNHHEMSFHWMMTTNHPLVINNLNPSETMLVAWACYQHRASYKGTFKNGFSSLINSADRGVPNRVSYMLERAIQYREKKFPEMSKAERLAGAIAHLKEKYGRNGYARYPNEYLKMFGKQLEDQFANIEEL